MSLPFFTISSIHLQAIHPTTNDATKPTIIASSPALSAPATLTASVAGSSIFFMSSSPSPRIGIITMKNENLATSSFLSPNRIPVAIVDPERLRPGKTATA